MRPSVALHGLSWGSSYVLRAGLRRPRPPLVGGLALTDNCNLHCRHCNVGRSGSPEMSFAEVHSVLSQLRAKDIPVLYIEGGEPFLWKDGAGKKLEDVVVLSRELGFLYTIVYSNGTFPLRTSADAIFVSMDGLRVAHNYIRGRTYDKILTNIMASRHPRILINYTINRTNEADIEEFTFQIAKIANVKGTFFYFYTPDFTHPEKDRELYLDLPERRRVVERLIALKRDGGRVLNSTAGLRLAVDKRWKKPNSLGYLFAEGQLYECCRYVDNPSICEVCGYLGFAEIDLMARFNPNAIFSALRYL